MPTKKLNSEQRFLRNLLIGFFSSLFIAFVLALIALFQTLTTYPSAPDLPTVTIQSCYDGNTCTTTEGEKIRLACIDAPEMKASPRLRPTSMQAGTYDKTSAIESRDYLRQLVLGKKVSIRRITTDRYGRTVAELFVDGINVGQILVRNGQALIYWKYANACHWTR